MSPALRFLSAQHWAIVPGVFDSLLHIVEQHDLGHRASVDDVVRAQSLRASSQFGDVAAGCEPLMQIRGDTAVIPVRGVLARYADQINGACQDQGRSAEAIQADIAKASQNPNVSRIILRIDSPGGSVAGTAETGAAIRAASDSGKQVVAFIDGMAASAAYWLASQADQIVASADGALVGSIGVIMAMVDATKSQEKQGYKVHVVRSVGLKAPGTANESLSSEQLASVQKVVADLHEQFRTSVASGRGLDQQQMDRAATGEVFTASEGIGMGLVDSVQSWESLIVSGDRSKPATAIVAAKVHQLPSSNPMGINDMSFVKQAKAIADAHPAHAALVWELAASDHTEDQIVAAVGVAEKEAAAAAKDSEISDLKAKLEAQATALAAAEATAAEATKKAIEATAITDALQAHAKGGKAGAAIKADSEESQTKKISRAEHDKNPAAYAAGIRSGALVLVD